MANSSLCLHEQIFLSWLYESNVYLIFSLALLSWLDDNHAFLSLWLVLFNGLPSSDICLLCLVLLCIWQSQMDTTTVRWYTELCATFFDIVVIEMVFSSSSQQETLKNLYLYVRMY